MTREQEEEAILDELHGLVCRAYEDADSTRGDGGGRYRLQKAMHGRIRAVRDKLKAFYGPAVKPVEKPAPATVPMRNGKTA